MVELGHNMWEPLTATFKGQKSLSKMASKNAIFKMKRSNRPHHWIFQLVLVRVRSIWPKNGTFARITSLNSQFKIKLQNPEKGRFWPSMIGSKRTQGRCVTMPSKKLQTVRQSQGYLPQAITCAMWGLVAQKMRQGAKKSLKVRQKPKKCQKVRFL